MRFVEFGIEKRVMVNIDKLISIEPGEKENETIICMPESIITVDEPYQTLVDVLDNMN